MANDKITLTKRPPPPEIRTLGQWAQWNQLEEQRLIAEAADYFDAIVTNVHRKAAGELDH